MREILLKQGDCLKLMKEIPDKSIDMILCDLPYGTTQLEWDVKIPFESLWKEYNRIIKDNGAILLFACQPFETDLINSNRKMFRYEWIWKKTTKSGFLDAKRKPLKSHENIVVFYKHRPTYNPQMYTVHTTKIGKKKKATKAMEQYRKDIKLTEYEETGKRYPADVIEFSSWNGAIYGNNKNAVKHPTQKPVPLLEYLIKTYTNEDDTVLDNCMGSGSTGVACINTKRNFIGFEKNKTFFEIAENRINQAIHYNPELLKEAEQK